MDAATSSEERNALIEKLTEAVEKKKIRTFLLLGKVRIFFIRFLPADTAASSRTSCIVWLTTKPSRVVFFLAGFMLLGIKPKWWSSR